jgi:hypothetical protein
MVFFLAFDLRWLANRLPHPTHSQFEFNNRKEAHMGTSKLVEAALIIVLIAAAIGQLPRLLQTVRVAQLKLLEESKSTKWGQALLLPTSK